MNVDYQLAQEKGKKMVLHKLIASASKSGYSSTRRHNTQAGSSPTLEVLRTRLLGPLNCEDARL